MAKLRGNGWLVPEADRVDIGEVSVYTHASVLADTRDLDSVRQRKAAKVQPSRIILHTVEAVSKNEKAMRQRYFEHANPPHFWMQAREVGNQKYAPDAHGSRYRVGMDKSRGGFDKVLQRVPLEYNARATAHPTGTPETNYMGKACAQIEIEGWAGDTHRYNDETLESIGLLVGKIAVWIRDTYEPDFRVIQYNDTGGVTNGYGVNGWYRMTDEEWRTGRRKVIGTRWTLCGHQNVPDNKHWDPGSLNFKKIADVANTVLDNTPTATSKPVPVSPPPPPTVKVKAPTPTPTPTALADDKDFSEVARLHRKIGTLQNDLATEYERLCL